MEWGTRDVAQWYSTCLTKPWNLFQIQEKEEEGEGKGQQQANTARLHFIRMSPGTEETEAGGSKFKAGLGCTAENLLTPTPSKIFKSVNQSIGRGGVWRRKTEGSLLVLRSVSAGDRTI